MNNCSFSLRNIILLPVIAVVFIAGCQTPKGELINEFSLKQYAIGTSVEQRPIDYSVIGHGDDTVMIIASIHGDEHAGSTMLPHLKSHLANNPQLLNGRKVVILPQANPDGVAHKQRHNANGVDLNRNFEAENRENNITNGQHALSEPEARIIKQLIESFKPDRIITYHQPLDCIDYDGPAKGLAYAMGRYCELPVKKLGARPGSLGAYAGETLGIPTITVELLEEDSFVSSDILWQKYGQSLLAAIIYPELPAGDLIPKSN